MISHWRATSVGEGGNLSCPFLKIDKKFSDFGKCVPFMCIYGPKSNLNYSFKSILEKKHQSFSLRDPSFACHTWDVLKVPLLQETSPAPGRFLIAHLNQYMTRRFWNLCKNSLPLSYPLLSWCRFLRTSSFIFSPFNCCLVFSVFIEFPLILLWWVFHTI